MNAPAKAPAIGPSAGPTYAQDPNVIFLIPGAEYEARICRAYIAATYPGTPASRVTTQFNLKGIVNLPDLKVVVLRRQPGASAAVRFITTQEGRRHEDVPVNDLVHEVLEAKAIRVGDYVKVTPGALFTETTASTASLIEALSEAAQPARVQPPNAPDNLLRMVIP